MARELAGMLVEAKKMGSGADLTSLVAPASMQLPISGIEVSVLGIAFAAPHLMRAPLEPTPERRMLQLMTAKLNAYARALPPWGKKPFNPTLGELLVAQEPGSSSPQWKVVAEQVSHHPPVTATALKSAHVSTLDELQTRPIFQGNTVEVAMTGPPERVVLRLPSTGGAEEEEVYEVLSRPSLCIRGILGLGRQFTEWAGTHEIVCARSRLRGVIEYGAAGLLGRVGAPPHQVAGDLRDVATGAVVATVRGSLDGGVVAELASPPPAAGSGGAPAAGTQSGSGTIVLLEPGSMTLLEALPAVAAAAYEAPRHSLFWPKQTSSVWCRLSAALVAQRWADAREAKRAVEQVGRAARAEREQSGRPWRPQLFAFDSGANAAAAKADATAGGDGVAGRWRPTADAFAEAWQAESPLSRRLLKGEGAADCDEWGGGGGGGTPGVLVPFAPCTPVAETTLIV